MENIFITRIRMPRFSIVEFMALTAAVAVAIAIPQLIIPVIVIVFDLLLYRIGLTPLAITLLNLMLAVIIGVLMSSYAIMMT